MSHNLFTNSEMPPNYSWKGKTITQLMSSIQKNKNNTILTKINLDKSQPLKIYRKEIASTPINSVQRTGISIDDINSPNGSIITKSITTSKTNGLDNIILDTKEPNLNVNNKTEHPGQCLSFTSNGICQSQEANARRRVRSSGIVKLNYCSSTSQYLNKRNLSFEQNQYHYTRSGNSSNMNPLNVYSTQGTSFAIDPSNQTTCSHKFTIVSDISFGYVWSKGNGTSVPSIVIIPAGQYYINEINQLLINTMTQNKHYYINKLTNTNVYLLKMVYNVTTNKVDLYSYMTNTTIFNINTFSPADSINNVIPSTTTESPYFYFTGYTVFSNLIGFSPSTFPISNVIQTTYYNTTGKTSFIASSSFSPTIGIAPFTPTYYKPNNGQFAVQGGVTASSYITRKKYNSITNNTVLYRKAYGNGLASAMAYGVSDIPYTEKSKMNYPTKKTPVFRINQIDTCNYKIRRG
jgi:hypothetical protein